MKRALLLSPHFIPSNLASVHRARIMARHLSDFGWEPLILTVDSRHYEESTDPTLNALRTPGIRVEYAGAIPASLCRLFRIGDISLRAQFTLRSKIAELVRRGRIDLIFVTVLPGYSSLVGAWTKKKFGMPFVLDYQDPWVSDWGAAQPRWSKAGLAHQIAHYLEPTVLPQVDAVTAVSDETLDTLRDRKLLRSGVPVEIIPIGAENEDHKIAARLGQSQVSKESGVIDLVYLGTLTERMLPALRALLLALREMIRLSPATRLRLHLIGTSAQSAGADFLGIAQIAAEIGVGDLLRVEPRRIPYLDALRTMHDADILLLLGSTDPHYTASKLFPYWLANRPTLALVHARSTINELARELGGIAVITYDDDSTPESQASEVGSTLRSLVAGKNDVLPGRNEGAFEPYSAFGVARSYAALFDRLLENQR